MHDLAGGGAHAGPHDIDLHPAEHRGGLQPAQHKPRARVAARAPALVHRGGLGLLHAPRAATLSRRDCHPLLGQVLRLFPSSRLVGLHRPHTSSHNLPCLCHPLLPQPGHSQVRGHSLGHSRARTAQGANRVLGRRGQKRHEHACSKHTSNRSSCVIYIYIYMHSRAVL